MIHYAEYFEDNKTLSFKVTDSKLLKNYNQYGKKLTS